MTFFIVIWNQILDWIVGNPAKVVTGVALASTVVIGGYQSYKYAEFKQGIVVHDPGYELIEQENGMYREWISNYRYPKNGKLSSTEWDIEGSPRAYAKYIAGIGKDRFPSYDCSSYNDIMIGDSTFKFVWYDRVTAHAAMFNSPTIAQCLVRTNNEKLNRRTRESFKRNIEQINDTLEMRYGNGIEFILFHSDVATNGKQDPHEHRTALDRMGLHYDNRLYPWRVESAPYKNGRK